MIGSHRIYRCGFRAISVRLGVVMSCIFVASTAEAQTIYTVMNNAPSGSGSLRQAISDMNTAGTSLNQIKFQISGSTVINLSSQLPTIQRSVSINPDNVTGIVLDGGGGSGNGLNFSESTVQGSTVRGLEIRDFSGNGVVIAPTSNESVTIQTCYIHDNGQAGISISGGVNHAILGQSVIQFNSAFGVTISSSVNGVQISGAAIQANDWGGIRLAGSNHDVTNCVISSNGIPESAGDHFGGIVFGGSSVSATDCTVHDSTLAGNTPFGAKRVSGAGNKLNRNETYLNATKGYQALSNVPVLSYFVIDDVHDKVVVFATLSGSANQQATVEFFDTYPVGSGQGAVYCGDVLVQLNPLGQGSVLASFDLDQVFQAVAISPNPVSFTMVNANFKCNSFEN